MNKLTVIVTGASSGIGKAITGYFLDKGHYVVMNSSNADNLTGTYQEFGSPANAVVVAGDTGQKDVGQTLVSTAVDRFGSVDVLINNAGLFESKPFLDVEEKDLDKFLNTNLKGTYFTTQAAIAQMLKQNGGAVINIGTVLVDHAIAGFPASAAVISKGGIHALTRQLASEFGKHNIRVNAIAPGIIRSPLQGKMGITDADSLAGLHLLDRIGETSDIAEAAYYLATSSFVSGEVLHVDGGHTAGHNFG
jgi:NAD(P)-dependent dehydrogenase (short-subunit alcohol dehydrogenase family)